MLISAADIVTKARILEEVFASDEPRPAGEHRVPDHRDYDPAVFHRITVRWRGVESSIAPLPSFAAGDVTLSQEWLHESDAGCEQRRVNKLAFARPVAMIKRHHCSERRVQRGPEIFERNKHTHGR